jgi:DNA-binding protein YbaB
VEGVSGGGLVSIKASAKGRIIGVSIDDSLMQLSEKQMLEDLIAAALNDARTKADAASSAEMSKMTAGLRCHRGSSCRSEGWRLGGTLATTFP